MFLFFYIFAIKNYKYPVKEKIHFIIIIVILIPFSKDVFGSLDTCSQYNTRTAIEISSHASIRTTPSCKESENTNYSTRRLLYEMIVYDILHIKEKESCAFSGNAGNLKYAIEQEKEKTNFLLNAFLLSIDTLILSWIFFLYFYKKHAKQKNKSSDGKTKQDENLYHVSSVKEHTHEISFSEIADKFQKLANTGTFPSEEDWTELYKRITDYHPEVREMTTRSMKERENLKIMLLLQIGLSQSDIGKLLGKNRSTISRRIKTFYATTYNNAANK